MYKDVCEGKCSMHEFFCKSYEYERYSALYAPYIHVFMPLYHFNFDNTCTCTI